MALQLHGRSPLDFNDIFNLNQNDDPRVGSTREDSDGGGTVTANGGSKSESLSKLGATFIPIAIYITVCLIIFIVLRRRWHRVYAPRTIPALRAPEPPSPALPDGWFDWVIPFFRIPDTVVLNHGSLDGFFFLRYIKVLRNICFAGCCIAWPILFPVHATGGERLPELEMLTIGNIKGQNAPRLYANVAVAWLLFGFVLFTVARESIYYVNLRQAYLSSPYYAKRLSSRTVLFTSVPKRYCDEARMRKLYGDAVRRVWVPRTSKGLVNLVKEREQTALRLERAEMELIRKANLARSKQIRTEEKKNNQQGGKMSLRRLLRRKRSDEQLEKAENGEAAHEHTGDPQKPPVSVRDSRSTNEEEPEEPEEQDHHDDAASVRERTVAAQRSRLTFQTGTTDDRQHFTDAEEELALNREDESTSISTGVMVSGPDGVNQDNEVSEQTIEETTPPVMTTPASQPAPNDNDNDIDMTYIHPYGLHPNLPDVRGSVAAQYLPAERRPHHRPIGNFGRRVDTIRWTRTRLIELNKRISKLRRQVLRGAGKECQTLPAVFVEFDTQEAAQAAHQILAHHQPLHMAPRHLGIRPDEVVWSALRMGWLERIVRRFAVLGLIVAGIVFWSIPSLIVGLISNIDTMRENVSFLYWLGDLPKPILGFLTGFVPAIALSLFMAIVPVLLRHAAAAAGVPSINMVELFTQTSYFAFQVVQVFLITTLTSAASGTIIQIFEQPFKAKDVLAANLPKASNFYISYILIQCLANAGTTLVRPVDVLRHAILSRVAQLPRAHYRLWRTMSPTRWGRDFPVFTNLGVIALSYACIAPLILIFAAIGMWFTHIVWRYNLIFVLDSDIDTKGLFYPRALMHILVGLYLAEICLIGLFIIRTAIGPTVLMVLLLVFTALVHFSIHHAIGPTVQNLPQTLSLEEEIQKEERARAEAARRRAEAGEVTDGAANTYFDEFEEFGDEEDDIGRLSDAADTSDEESEPDNTPDPIGNRAVEGAADFRVAITSWFKDWSWSTVNEQTEAMGIKPEDLDKPPSFIMRWLRPHIHEDFIAIRKSMMDLPDDLDLDSMVQGKDHRNAYLPPEMWAPKPVLWIPSDEARVSRQEVAHTRKSTPIFDTGARLEENGRLTVEDLGTAPIAVPRRLL